MLFNAVRAMSLRSLALSLVRLSSEEAVGSRWYLFSRRLLDTVVLIVAVVAEVRLEEDSGESEENEGDGVTFTHSHVQMDRSAAGLHNGSSVVALSSTASGD